MNKPPERRLLLHSARQSLEATEQQKRLAISLISACHTLNHLQYSITSVIFPV